MVLAIDQNIYNQAKALADAGDVAGAWNVLGNAGDKYAQGAHQIISQHGSSNPTNVLAMIADANWEMIAGQATTNQYFMQVAQSHLDSYLGVIKNGSSNYTLPNTQQIEESYKTAIELYNLDPKLAAVAYPAILDYNLDNSSGLLDPSFPLDISWGNSFDIESGRLVFNSDTFSDQNLSVPEVMFEVGRLITKVYEKYGMNAAIEAASTILGEDFLDVSLQLADNYLTAAPGLVLSLISWQFSDDQEKTEALISLLNKYYEIPNVDVDTIVGAISGVNIDGIADDTGYTKAELAALAGNTLLSEREIMLPGGYSAYVFQNGDQVNITPLDNDATYKIQFSYPETDPDNPTVISPEDYWGDLLVDLSASTKTADEALAEVPLTSGLPPKATVDNGTTQEEYVGYDGIDGKDALESLGADYPDDIVVVKKPIYDENGNETGEKTVGSYANVDKQALINGKPYYQKDLLDSIADGAKAVAGFIAKQADSFVDFAVENGGLQLAFIDFANAFSDDLAAGTLSFEDALEEFAKIAANRFLQQQITGALTTDQSKALIQEVLTDGLGMNSEQAGNFAPVLVSSISQMLSTFAVQSSGWDSDQYAKAATAIAANAAITYVVKDYLRLDGVAVDTTLNVAGQIITSLINSGEISDEQWEDIGLQIGATAISAAFGLPDFDLSTFDGNKLEIYVNTFIYSASAMAGLVANVLLPGSGLFVAAVTKVFLSAVQGELYDGKKFYQGEFGDKGALLNSIYQIQDLEVDDGLGGTTTVQALVASNTSGSTILLSNFNNGFDYAIGNDGADVLVGDDTGDIMSGGGGGDYIEGKEGDENISGGDGSDHLIGAEGDDVIQGDAGNDIIFGDDGEDTILGGDGQDFIHGGSGDDTISGGLERDTILASGGNDVVQGAEGDDMIDGGYGDDLLDGGEGNDLLLGNLGNDSITAGDGDDKIFGDSGNDTVMGGAGNDYINGGEGVDILQGDNGDDLIDGGSGDDYLQGDLGNDNLIGGLGEDTILGGLDDDFIQGQAGSDSLDGGNGNDILRGGGADDALAGGAGDDVYILEANDSGGYGNDSITDADGANDRIYINGLNSGNLSDLTMTRDGDNLTISYNAVLIGTVVDHFVAGGANAIERIEFDNDKFIDLTAITVDGGTGAVTYSSATDATQTTRDDIDSREADVSANLTQQSQFWNNTFLQNLSDIAYEEALKDEFETEYYNGTSIVEYKRDRGTFGGHYKVYKLEMSDTIQGTAFAYKYEELEAGYDPNDYLEIVNGEQYHWDQFYGSYGHVDIHAGEFDYYYVDDLLVQQEATHWDDEGVQSAYHIRLYGDGLPDLDLEVNSGGGWGGSSPAFMQTYGTLTNMDLGKTEVSGADRLVGAWWGEVINGGSGDDALFGNGGDDTINGEEGDDWLFGGDGDDTVDGGTGDDIIFGGDGDDELLEGGDGNDAIFGGDGDDYISGGDGADWIDAGDGADIIIGGAGDDTIYAGGGNDHAEGGEGLDVIYGQGGNDIIYGNEGVDWLYGESGDDEILGVHDEDHLYGGVGNDTISYRLSTAGVTISLLTSTASGGYAEGDTFYDFENIKGSDHDDTLTGDDNVNKIWGYDGADTLNGLGGNDYIWGGLDGDTIDGGDDEDYISYYSIAGGVEINMNGEWVIGLDTSAGHVQDNFLNIERAYGSVGDDIINGDSNDNRLYGYQGNDVISGGAGNDKLYGHYSGAHELKGNVGSDLLYGGLDGDILNGGNDEDGVSYFYSDQGVTIDLVNGTVDGNGTGGTQDTLQSIENAYGTNLDDVITGDDNANRLYGYDGNDTLNGNGGDDYLFGYYTGIHTMNGGDGNDFLYGGLDGDVMDGGNGTDAVSYLYSDVGVLVKTGQDFAENIAGGGTQDTFTSIENAYGSNFDDELSGDSGTNYLYGNEGNDILKGGDGNDFLKGEEGDDTIYGHLGDDVIYGDAGNDAINGGGGNDTISYYASLDDLIIDLSGSLASGTSIGLDYIANFETVLGGSGDDTITGSANADTLDGYIGDDTINGGDGDDTLYGNSGEDYLYGGDGNDTLNGGSDSDYLFGDAGNDTLNGDSGSDILYASSGSDTLNGGSGSDYASFKFSNAGVNVDLSTNTLSGGDAAGDTLISIEKLQGSDHDDTLTGDAVNNYLVGRDGADTLNGMEGSDLLWGEGGNDIFVFSDLTHSTDTAQDTIKDFAQGNDQIDLTAFTFTAITDFTISNAGGQTIVDDNSSAFSFAMDGTYTLVNSDFIFV